MRSRTIGETSSISVVAEGVAISFRYDRKSVHSARVREEKSKHAPFNDIRLGITGIQRIDLNLQYL